MKKVAHGEGPSKVGEKTPKQEGVQSGWEGEGGKATSFQIKFILYQIGRKIVKKKKEMRYLDL